MGLFGPSKSEVWRTLSAMVGGSFTDGGLIKGDRVDAKVDNWTVTLDAVKEDKAIYTRLRAPFCNPSGLRFSIARTGPCTELVKGLGFQEIIIGDHAFDEAFGVTGNNVAAVTSLLQDVKIRSILLTLPEVQFEVRDNDGWSGTQFPADCDELYFIARGAMKNINQLKGLFDLFAEVLHELTVIGAASEANPGVTL